MDGGDPILAARQLGDAIYHIHAEDVRMERGLVGTDGVLDTKTTDRFSERSWNYVALGYGHDTTWWREFFSVARMSGYDGPISLENEDLMYGSTDFGHEIHEITERSVTRKVCLAD